jgi:hypothetical protein
MMAAPMNSGVGGGGFGGGNKTRAGEGVNRVVVVTATTCNGANESRR